jgi:uncharacterized protein (DUF983 family)
LPNTPTVRWEPDRTPQQLAWPHPPMLTALGRGFMGRCPACGQTHVFNGYLRVVPECTVCHAPLGELRADDAPPYFTIVVVGHIIIPAMLALEKAAAPPIWLQAALWVPLTLAMSLALLRPIKGATVGLMLRLGMFKPQGE